MNLKNVIFNADDLGMSVEIDNTILSAASCGFIQSASVSVVNGLDFNQFEKFLNLEHPLKLGLHVNLTEGSPISGASKVASLVNSSGNFQSATQLLLTESILEEEMLYTEMKAQLKRFVQLFGTKPNHIDSHQHYTYLSPVAFKAFLRIAESENLNIRNPIPFLNQKRLLSFIHQVHEKYGVALNFLPEKRSIELCEIFSVFKVKSRSDDCLVEFPSYAGLMSVNQTTRYTEIICHPHIKDELQKLKTLFEFSFPMLGS